MQIELDAELIALLDSEKASMRTLLMIVADARKHDPEAARDVRYVKAAANLRHLAGTVMDVDNELLLKVAMIARAVEDNGAGNLIAQLVSAKLLAIAFELPPYANATAVLRSITDTADVAQAKAMGSLN